mgnify:CR=1 FL=1
MSSEAAIKAKHFGAAANTQRLAAMEAETYKTVNNVTNEKKQKERKEREKRKERHQHHQPQEHPADNHRHSRLKSTVIVHIFILFSTFLLFYTHIISKPFICKLLFSYVK